MPVFLAPVVLGALRIGVGVAARQIAKNQVKRAAAVAAKGAAKSAKAAKPGTSKITKTASGYAIGSAASKVRSPLKADATKQMSKVVRRLWRLS